MAPVQEYQYVISVTSSDGSPLAEGASVDAAWVTSDVVCGVPAALLFTSLWQPDKALVITQAAVNKLNVLFVFFIFSSFCVFYNAIYDDLPVNRRGLFYTHIGESLNDLLLSDKVYHQNRKHHDNISCHYNVLAYTFLNGL